MKTNKSYFDLTESERLKLAELTPKEKRAVETLRLALKSLPPSLCIEMNEYHDSGIGLVVSKRITPGSCMEVAFIRKKSLIF